MSKNNNLRSTKTLEHCTFNWSIHDFSMTLAEVLSLSSPTFALTSATWHLEFDVNSKEGTIILLPRLCRSSDDEGPDEVKAKFSFTLELFNGIRLWSAENCLVSFKKGSNWGGIFTTKLATLKENIFQNTNYNDTLFVKCDMIAVDDVSANLCEINGFGPDLRILSKDLITLYENGDHGNAYLVVEESDILVHKEILSIWSRKFSESFETGNSYLEVVHYKRKVIEAMVKFLYSGDVHQIAINEPPPVELYQCAREYEIVSLENFLRPKEFVDDTYIGTEMYSYNWEFPNFSALCKSENLFDNPVTGLLGGNDEFILFVGYNGQYGAVTCNIEAHNLTRVACISCKMSVLDNFGFEHFSKSKMQYPVHPGMCQFSFSFEIESLFGQENVILPQDTLIIHCDFKVRFKNGFYSSGNFPYELSNWENCDYKVNFPLLMENLLLKPSYADAKITVNKTEINVHKSVLSARSPVFKSIFQNEDTVQMKYPEPVIRQVLYYIYTGMLMEVEYMNLIQIHQCADFLSIPRLKVKCHKILRCRVTYRNACALYLFSVRYNYQDLKLISLRFILENADIVLTSSSWKELKEENENLALYILTRAKQVNL